MNPPHPATVMRTLADAIDHARSAWPHEACGFLLGTAHGEITGSRRARNASTLRDHFAIVPLELVTAATDALRERLALVGVYHSHPHGDPVPSPADTEAAHQVWLDRRSWFYVILGVHAGVVTPRTWRFHQGWLSSSETA